VSTKKSWTAVCATISNVRTGSRRVKSSWGSYIGTESTHTQRIEHRGMVELTIDIGALMDLMGQRALITKSGRSSYMGGLVKAKVLDRKGTVQGPVVEIPLDAGCEICEPRKEAA
jgi:hypothetical protein